MRPITVTVGPLASASANNICTSQSPSGAGALTLNGAVVSGGVAILDAPRRILFTDSSDTSAKFTVYGTNAIGVSVSEVVTGPNGGTATYTVQDFATVTKITTSAAASGLTVGTNGIASSWPISLDTYGMAQTSLQIDLTGTISATVQQTVNRIMDPSTGLVDWTKVKWVNHPDSNLVNMTSGSIQGNYAYVPAACRILLNSGTGSAVLTALQSGTPNR